MASFTKDPQATLDYRVDWSKYLGADTITASTWTVPAGINQATATNDATSTTIWLTGGTDGTDYQLSNRITTAAGRTDERTFRVQVRQR